MAQKTIDQIANDNPLSTVAGTELFLVNQASVTKAGALSILSNWILGNVTSNTISDATTLGKALLVSTSQVNALSTLGAQAALTAGAATDIETGTATADAVFSAKDIHDAIVALAPVANLVKTVNGTSPDVAGNVVLTIPSYVDATTTASGLMSAADKTKLDGVAANANDYVLSAATTSVLGGVLQSAAQADSVAADVPTVVADLNALLAKLRTAGILAP